MEQNNDLTSIYESMYRPQGTVVTESSTVVEEAAPKFKKKVKGKKSRKGGMDKKTLAAVTYDSYSFDNVFGKVLKEMEEMGGDFGGEDDNVFDADEGGFEDEFSGDGESISLEELRNMTLGEIVDLLAGGGPEDEGDEFEDEGDEFGFEGDLDEGDEIPTEAYAFDGGEGNPKGAQGTYDGKARRQAKTTHVKDNGDMKFDQDTGYDPDNVEGSEGSEHGAQGNYDGKARALPKTTHVKGNGDADFGKAKTGIKTSTGKKEKNYF